MVSARRYPPLQPSLQWPMKGWSVWPIQIPRDTESLANFPALKNVRMHRPKLHSMRFAKQGLARKTQPKNSQTHSQTHPP